jgi:hypothetical protein
VANAVHAAGSLLALAVLSACQVQHPVPDSNTTGTATQPLVAPDAAIPQSARQRLRAMVGDREIVLDCVVEVTPDRVTVVGLLPAGNRVFSVRYDGRKVEQERTPQVPAQLQPEQLLADLQLAFWPLEALRGAFDGSSWKVSQADSRTRRLLRDGRLVAEVHYGDSDPWRGRVWLVNLERGYALIVDSVPLEQDT